MVCDQQVGLNFLLCISDGDGPVVLHLFTIKYLQSDNYISNRCNLGRLEISFC